MLSTSAESREFLLQGSQRLRNDRVGPLMGELRFRPPLPMSDAEGDVDATRFRASPIQRTSWQPDGLDTSEHCLYLNVWTQDISGSRPLVVWIYGGGYEGGSDAPPFVSGDALSALTDTVVVAMNYRVDGLGPPR